MTTRSTALCSSERILASLRGSRLTPERSSKSSDLGARIHSVPRSSRRHGAQLESSSSTPSSASAAVTLARVAQRPRFLNRSTNSAIVQQREALTQFWCSVYGSLNSGSGSRRARSNSIPARPYICRFSILSRVMCPSTGPLLHGVLTADSTA
jgi:hypothetical protein